MEYKRDTYYDVSKDNTAFERCIDVMSRLILKYDPDMLERIEWEKQEKCKKRIAKKRIICYDTHIAMRGGTLRLAIFDSKIRRSERRNSRDKGYYIHWLRSTG